MIKTSHFSYKGRSLEVRAASFDNEWRVRVFENEKRATPVEYSVMIETAFDGKESLIDRLIQIARDDVKEGRVPLVNPAST